MCSRCFGHYYIHHQELATILLNHHIGLLFLVRCVLEFRCGWVGVVSVLQAEAMLKHNCFRSASACNTDTTPTQPHRNSNTHRTKNNSTNVVIQQNSRKLLMMDILMSETFWTHKKLNKIASDIKLVFYSSTITMMHGPINIRYVYSLWKEELVILGIMCGACNVKLTRFPRGNGVSWTQPETENTFHWRRNQMHLNFVLITSAQ